MSDYTAAARAARAEARIKAARDMIDHMTAGDLTAPQYLLDDIRRALDGDAEL